MRIQDWPTALFSHIESAKEKEFSWGEHDCCLFAADCCIALCGKDPAQAYRGTYTTATGAKRALTKNHGSIEAAFDAVFERVDTAFAQRGDVVVFESELGLTAGIQGVDGVVWSVSLNGLAILKPEVKTAWRVE